MYFKKRQIKNLTFFEEENNIIMAKWTENGYLKAFFRYYIKKHDYN